MKLQHCGYPKYRIGTYMGKE